MVFEKFPPKIRAQIKKYLPLCFLKGLQMGVEYSLTVWESLWSEMEAESYKIHSCFDLSNYKAT